MRRRSPHGPWSRLVLMVSAIGLFVVGYYWGNQYRYGSGPPAIEGVLIAPAMPLPGFELADATGRTFTHHDLADRWTLLGFGEISSARGQLAVTRMMDIYNRLAEHAELRARVQMALAASAQSLNLARDFGRLSPALRILSGEAEELDRIGSVLGERPGTGSGERPALYLIAPDGNLLALFAAGQSAAAVAADLISLSDWPLEALAPSPNE